MVVQRGTGHTKREKKIIFFGGARKVSCLWAFFVFTSIAPTDKAASAKEERQQFFSVRKYSRTRVVSLWARRGMIRRTENWKEVSILTQWIATSVPRMQSSFLRFCWKVCLPKTDNWTGMDVVAVRFGLQRLAFGVSNFFLLAQVLGVSGTPRLVFCFYSQSLSMPIIDEIVSYYRCPHYQK